MELNINSTALLKALLDVSKFVNVPDAVCIVIRCGYDVTYEVDYPDVSPEQFVEENSWPEELYHIHDWPAIEKEIQENIRALRNDEIELGRYIRGILCTMEDILTIFYDSSLGYRQSIFQKIVPFLKYGARYDKLPQVFVDIHRGEIEFRMFNNPEEAPVDFEAELEKRCNETLYCLNHAEDYPCFRHCRYLHLGVFKRLATIIESYLLEYGCKKDLFAYQKECGIELHPSLKAADVAHERGLTVDHVINNWANGYSRLDAFTEFANYGNIQDRVSAMGIDFIGIPEVDSLLVQLERIDQPDYPEHHFKRNLRRFAKRCKELAESNVPEEEKKAFLVNLILILSRCYGGFLEYPELNGYVTYAMRLFIVAEAAFMKGLHPICVKDVCVEMGCEYMLDDYFPDTEHFRRVWLKCGEVPTVPWEQFFIQSYLEKTLSYLERHLCGSCTNLACSYRKIAPKQQPLLVAPQSKAQDKKKIFGEALCQMCSILASDPNSLVKKGSVPNTWRLNKAKNLYAYIGYALKKHLDMPKVLWEDMFPILQTDCDATDLKTACSKIKKALESGSKKGLPEGYKAVDDAITKLPPVNRASAA